jgi:hypothetical protein
MEFTLWSTRCAVQAKAGLPEVQAEMTAEMSGHAQVLSPLRSASAVQKKRRNELFHSGAGLKLTRVLAGQVSFRIFVP